MADNFILIAQVAVVASFVWNIVQTYEFVLGKLRHAPAGFTDTSQLLLEQVYVTVQDIKCEISKRARKTRRKQQQPKYPAPCTPLLIRPRRSSSVITIVEE